jgi:hypothetical protein
MQELLENIFKILTTIVGLVYFGISIILARTIGYKGLGFKISPKDHNDNSNYDPKVCSDCIEGKGKGKENKHRINIFGRSIKFNIKKNTIFIIWISFILGCLFIGNSLTGYLDFLTSIDIIGKIISLGIIFFISINSYLLYQIIRNLKKCHDACETQFQFDMMSLLNKVKTTSFTFIGIVVLATVVILFAPKTFKKIGKKK